MTNTRIRNEQITSESETDGYVLTAGGTGTAEWEAQASGAGGALLIYNDSSFIVTGTAISFDNGLDVVSTGTTAYVNFDEEWIDYSTGSTVVGWSSFTAKEIEYSRLGNKVFVHFKLVGTSNSTSASFTLPYSETISGSFLTLILTRDNSGTRTVGYVDIESSNANLRYTPGTTGWTASNIKEAYGEFWYWAG